MSQQEMDFGLFATPICNHVRRRHGPPRPNRAGLFDAAGVTICGRRQCHFELAVNMLFGTVQHREKSVTLVARDTGLWDPVDVLTACTTAHGWTAAPVDAKAAPRNAGGIDELRIAAVLAADGIRPYLSRRTWSDQAGGWLGAGEPTSALHAILYDQANTGDYNVRRGLRALEDVGLLEVQLGPRGGMAKATCAWTPLAYLPVQPFAPVDEVAMEALA